MRYLVASLLTGALLLPCCTNPFSDKEWYCRGAAEGVPPESARSVYRYCLARGYDEHVRDRRQCEKAAQACCSSYCRCKGPASEDECNKQLQTCGRGHDCFFVLASDCKC